MQVLSQQAEIQQEAVDLKRRGDEYFRNESYTKAIKTYTRAIHNVEEMLLAVESKARSWTESHLALLYANRAAALLMQDRVRYALQDCTHALKMNPRYTRAIVRKARGLVRLGQVETALELYNSVNGDTDGIQKVRS